MASRPTPPHSAFDRLAAHYDDEFTHTTLGTLMRQAVWRRLEARFAAGTSVLEVNCGTGEDAVFLARRGVAVLATDASSEMVARARHKVTTAGLGERVRVKRCAMESLADLEAGEFDGILSNFGGLNCVSDLQQISQGLASRLRPGGVAVLVVMGPMVPWEWLWFLTRGRVGTAFRRLAPAGVAWRGQWIRYPSMARLRRAFAPRFRLQRACAIGALVPPPYAEAWALRHPKIVERLNRWERRLETRFPLPQLADHYLLEMARL